MEKLRYEYERLDEKGEYEWLPLNDLDAKITGRIVIGLKQWLDENPEERKRLGWIKLIYHDAKDVVEYNPQTQYVVKTPKIIDEYTVEDDYRVLDKPEEMLAIEEILEGLGILPSGNELFAENDRGGIRFF